MYDELRRGGKTGEDAPSSDAKRDTEAENPRGDEAEKDTSGSDVKDDGNLEPVLENDKNGESEPVSVRMGDEPRE